jgi:hypothetical protein
MLTLNAQALVGLRMTNLTTTPPSSNKSPNRPDGTDIRRYKSINKWTYRRWAWEFLRRNEEFIRKCDSLNADSDEEEKQRVADQFGLRRFKDYREPYAKKSGMPKFEIGTIKSHHNLDLSRNEAISKRIKIQPGEVLIRFDLNQAADDIQALKKQLRLANQSLIKHLSTYTNQPRKREFTHAHDFKRFGIYLRLLDLKNSNVSHLNCAKAIFTNFENTPKENLPEDHIFNSGITKRYSAAKKYANSNYRYLACWHAYETPDLKDEIPLKIFLSSSDE